MCHGPHGEGIEKYPKLVGRDPAAGFVFASDAKVPKTIGNYWPYATTLYDYIHRTMPLSAPGSLTPDETYGVVAFLLSENGIVPSGTVIDAKSLPGVKMPARSHFVRDDRTGGKTFR
jgi:S-disulfanyl-L-cysteine oxidoreductase SoxD